MGATVDLLSQNISAATDPPQQRWFAGFFRRGASQVRRTETVVEREHLSLTCDHLQVQASRGILCPYCGGHLALSRVENASLDLEPENRIDQPKGPVRE